MRLLSRHRCIFASTGNVTTGNNRCYRVFLLLMTFLSFTVSTVVVATVQAEHLDCCEAEWFRRCPRQANESDFDNSVESGQSATSECSFHEAFLMRCRRNQIGLAKRGTLADQPYKFTVNNSNDMSENLINYGNKHDQNDDHYFHPTDESQFFGSHFDDCNMWQSIVENSGRNKLTPAEGRLGHVAGGLGHIGDDLGHSDDGLGHIYGDLGHGMLGSTKRELSSGSESARRAAAVLPVDYGGVSSDATGVNGVSDVTGTGTGSENVRDNANTNSDDDSTNKNSDDDSTNTNSDDDSTNTNSDADSTDTNSDDDSTNTNSDDDSTNKNSDADSSTSPTDSENNSNVSDNSSTNTNGDANSTNKNSYTNDDNSSTSPTGSENNSNVSDNSSTNTNGSENNSNVSDNSSTNTNGSENNSNVSDNSSTNTNGSENNSNVSDNSSTNTNGSENNSNVSDNSTDNDSDGIQKLGLMAAAKSSFVLWGAMAVVTLCFRAFLQGGPGGFGWEYREQMAYGRTPIRVMPL